MNRFHRLLLILLLGALSYGASAQTLTLPKKLRVRPGDAFYIDIRGDALIRGLAAVQLTLNYKLKQPADAPPLIPLIQNPRNPVEIKIFELLPEPFISSAIRDEALAIAAVSFSQVKAGFGPGMLMAIPFQVSPQTPSGTVYTLFFSRHDIGGVDSSKSTTQSVAVIGSLIVDDAAPLLGDVTGDGRVNVLDVVRLVRFVAKLDVPTDQQFYNGDVSPHNGKLSVTDVVATLKRAIGVPIQLGPVFP
jgi:hypothetical protein